MAGGTEGRWEADLLSTVLRPLPRSVSKVQSVLAEETLAEDVEQQLEEPATSLRAEREWIASRPGTSRPQGVELIPQETHGESSRTVPGTHEPEVNAHPGDQTHLEEAEDSPDFAGRETDCYTGQSLAIEAASTSSQPLLLNRWGLQEKPFAI